MKRWVLVDCDIKFACEVRTRGPMLTHTVLVDFCTVGYCLLICSFERVGRKNSQRIYKVLLSLARERKEQIDCEKNL